MLFRSSNKNKIKDIFIKHIRGIFIPESLNESTWVPFGVPVVCDSKELKRNLVRHLETNGVQTRNYFAGNLLMHPGYKHLGNYKEYPESNKVLDLVFFIGCAPTISEENINHIESVLKSFA